MKPTAGWLPPGLHKKLERRGPEGLPPNNPHVQAFLAQQANQTPRSADDDDDDNAPRIGGRPSPGGGNSPELRLLMTTPTTGLRNTDDDDDDDEEDDDDDDDSVRRTTAPAPVQMRPLMSVTPPIGGNIQQQPLPGAPAPSNQLAVIGQLDRQIEGIVQMANFAAPNLFQNPLAQGGPADNLSFFA